MRCRSYLRVEPLGTVGNLNYVPPTREPNSLPTPTASTSDNSVYMNILRSNILRGVTKGRQISFRYSPASFYTSPRFIMQKSNESHLERTATEPRGNVRRRQAPISQSSYEANYELQDLHSVILSKIDQIDPRVRIFRLDLPKPVQVSGTSPDDPSNR